MFFSIVTVLWLVGVFILNYKPKLTDETLMVNYLTLNGRKSRATYEAARNLPIL